MTDHHLNAQDNINTVRAWINTALPRGLEGPAESAFWYLETANERLRANDITWAQKEIVDAIGRLREHLALPHTEEERPALQEAIDRLEQILADLADS